MLWLISADSRMTRIGIMVIHLEDSTARSTPVRPTVRARCRQRDSSLALTAQTPAAQAHLGNLRNLGTPPNRPRENDLGNLGSLATLRDRSGSRRNVRKQVAEIAGIAEI